MKMDPRMWFGFGILVGMFILAMATALGHVEEASSFGLKEVLIILGVLAGGFTQWAFSKKEP